MIIFMKMILKLLFKSDLKSWDNRLKQCKTFKKDISKELMPIV